MSGGRGDAQTGRARCSVRRCANDVPRARLGRPARRTPDTQVCAEGRCGRLRREPARTAPRGAVGLFGHVLEGRGMALRTCPGGRTGRDMALRTCPGGRTGRGRALRTCPGGRTGRGRALRTCPGASCAASIRCSLGARHGSSDMSWSVGAGRVLSQPHPGIRARKTCRGRHVRADRLSVQGRCGAGSRRRRPHRPSAQTWVSGGRRAVRPSLAGALSPSQRLTDNERDLPEGGPPAGHLTAPGCTGVKPAPRRPVRRHPRTPPNAPARATSSAHPTRSPVRRHPSSPTRRAND